MHHQLSALVRHARSLVPPRRRKIVLGATAFLLAFGTPAQAMSRPWAEFKTLLVLLQSFAQKRKAVKKYPPDEALDSCKAITDRELQKIAGFEQERKAQEDAKKKKDKQNGKETKSSELNIGGQGSTAGVTLGSVSTLSFRVLDADGNQVSDPAIAAVRYEAIIDPVDVSLESLDPDVPPVGPAPPVPFAFVTLGISTSAANDFGLFFSVTGVESWIRATPLDVAGNPITYEGVEDGNGAAAGGSTLCQDCLVTPEPRVNVLLAGGLLLLGVGAARGAARRDVGRRAGAPPLDPRMS